MSASCPIFSYCYPVASFSDMLHVNATSAYIYSYGGLMMHLWVVGCMIECCLEYIKTNYAIGKASNLATLAVVMTNLIVQSELSALKSSMFGYGAYG